MSGMSNETELVGLSVRVEYAKEIEVNRTYILTVNLALGSAESWPEMEGEDYPFYCSVYCYGFDCRPLDKPIVRVQRSGDSDGAARFAIRATSRCKDAMFWVTVANKYKMPIKRINLPITAF